MCLETYFKIIDVNNNEKLWGVDLCIDEEIGSMDKQLLVYILPWEEFDITKDELKKILLANCELVDKDEFYNEKSSD